MAKIIVPVVTVFDDDDKPDFEANKKVIDFLASHKVDGILVLGSTGEFTELSVEEKKAFFQFYADYTNGRVKLYAGTGCINFKQTLELSNSVYDMGYCAPIVIGPFYYGLDQEKIFIYYDTLAKKLNGNMYLYNYPARSGHSISAETVRRLIDQNSNIIGFKDTVNEPSHTGQICQATEGTGFEVYSGFDDQFLYNLSAGGCGSIGGLANIVPDIWTDLIQAANAENFSRVMKLTHLLHKLMPIYTLDSNCSLLLKKLMTCRGVSISSTSIFPFDEYDQAVFQKAKSLLEQVLQEYQKMK